VLKHDVAILTLEPVMPVAARFGHGLKKTDAFEEKKERGILLCRKELDF
jgi:hypothetical protein